MCDADGGGRFAEQDSKGIDLQTLAFMKEVLGRGRFARPLGAPTQHHYTQCPRSSQPVVAQDEPRPS